MTFEQIKKNFERKLWNKQMVAKAVEKGVITTNIFIFHEVMANIFCWFCK